MVNDLVYKYKNGPKHRCNGNNPGLKNETTGTGRIAPTNNTEIKIIQILKIKLEICQGLFVSNTALPKMPFEIPI